MYQVDIGYWIFNNINHTLHYIELAASFNECIIKIWIKNVH